MKKNTVLSIVTQVEISNTIQGAFWIGAGFFGLFDNLICRLLTLLMLLLAIACLAVLRTHKREADDEMSESHMKDAQAHTLSAVQTILTVIAIAVPFIPNDILNTLNWNRVLPCILFIIIGLLNVITGITFKHIEEEA